MPRFLQFKDKSLNYTSKTINTCKSMSSTSPKQKIQFVTYNNQDQISFWRSPKCILLNSQSKSKAKKQSLTWKNERINSSVHHKQAPLAHNGLIYPCQGEPSPLYGALVTTLQRILALFEFFFNFYKCTLCTIFRNFSLVSFQIRKLCEIHSFDEKREFGVQ